MSKPKTEGRRPDGMTHKEHSAVVMNLALQLADDYARGDIESFALCVGRGDECGIGNHIYDIASFQSRTQVEDAMEDLRLVQRAARYIDLRMPHLPYEMHRDPANPNRVWFTDKE